MESDLLRKLITTAVLVLVLQCSAFVIAFGQDFNTLIASANTANQAWVTQIDTALQASDLSTLQAGNLQAQTLGNSVRASLAAALPLAPNDAARSRVQGLLQHVNAALASQQAVTQATTLDAARSALNAARGEAVETQNELQPFAVQTPVSAPVTLPVTGGMPLPLAIVAGLLTLGAGVAARRFGRRESTPTIRQNLAI